MRINWLRVGARTAWRLGLWNVLCVLLYRVRVRFGIFSSETGNVASDDLFAERSRVAVSTPAPVVSVKCFGWKPVEISIGATPDWFLDPFSHRRYPDPHRPWHQLPDFDKDCGDIKCIWELSRWEWVVRLAQRGRHAGDASAITTLNAWLRDWVASNPCYRGPNWKCGQEASIRVMHVAMAALILGQMDNPGRGLIDLVRLHLQRVEPTLSYAIAQDNNHGTSEAAALFIGGSWLAALGGADGRRWANRGRNLLERRVARLVERDGSFSQYSMNYHRLLLDTLSMAEVWRIRMGLPTFSSLFTDRAVAAAHWLHAMTDPTTGDAPNLGGNDGARLLPLSEGDYRDHRPSVQLAMALFAKQAAYPAQGSWNMPLEDLGIELPEVVAPKPESRQFDDGGYAVLRRGSGMALMRYPRFHFRPSHADVLHLDLWKDGVNLLRDAGTFSYNADTELMSYFAGTASHNTVQFDERDQMPRLGRFLFGDWLKPESIETLNNGPAATTFAAGYCDDWGARHQRRAALRDTGLTVQDRLQGVFRKAVLRWRLTPGAWRVTSGCISNGAHSLSIKATIPIRRMGLVTGWESRYYMKRTELPILEVEVNEPGELISEYRWP